MPTGRGLLYASDGSWISGSVRTNPADQTVRVESGPLPVTGNYLVSIRGAGSVSWVYDAQHRNAANSANVQSQRGRPAAGDTDFVFGNVIFANAQERVRCLLQGAIIGEVQMSLFFVLVQ